MPQPACEEEEGSCCSAHGLPLLGDYGEEAGPHHFLLVSVKEDHGASAKTLPLGRTFT